ncbi:hypothetical protein HA402_001322 [Bradysia odoriphaga]|nr:hypothetical protein HA402_001322 [Bradysia odoriphaga]
MTIADILNDQRQRIVDDMDFFEHPRYSENLAVLTPETNGTPFRSVIITSWRSGSTFLGEILNAMPGNYYHYEPLMDFDIIQIRGEPHAKRAVYNLKQFLKCNYTDMNDFLDVAAENEDLLLHNTRLWKYCLLYPQHCLNPDFLASFCKLFPLQSMKVVRLRLALAEELLNDPHLNVRIVLLIRDPRGTMQSRKHRIWCLGHSDCDQADILCEDLVSDYNAAEIFLKKYPQRFKVVRYEDLSLDPFQITEEILKFCGLPLNPMVEEFLDTHTRNNMGDDWSTFRDSKWAPFHWMRDLTYEEIETIQNSCTKAMELWRYRKIDDQHMYEDKLFNPILSFPLIVGNETFI